MTLSPVVNSNNHLQVPHGWQVDSSSLPEFAVTLKPGKPEKTGVWYDIYNRMARWNGRAWELVKRQDRVEKENSTKSRLSQLKPGQADFFAGTNIIEKNEDGSYEITVPELSELKGSQLREAGLSPRRVAEMTPLEQLRTLKSNFDRLRKELPDGQYYLDGYDEQRRRIYSKWFEKDPQAEFLHRLTKKPHVPGPDSIIRLNVKSPNFPD